MFDRGHDLFVCIGVFIVQYFLCGKLLSVFVLLVLVDESIGRPWFSMYEYSTDWCAGACVCARVRACVRVCVCECLCVGEQSSSQLGHSDIQYTNSPENH